MIAASDQITVVSAKKKKNGLDTSTWHQHCSTNEKVDITKRASIAHELLRLHKTIMGQVLQRSCNTGQKLFC